MEAEVFEIDFKEMGCEDVVRVHMAQNWEEMWSFVNMGVKFRSL